MNHPAILSDDEVAAICRPLRQKAAQARYLRRLGLHVDLRPDGSPLVSRTEWDRRSQRIDQPSPRSRGPQWSVQP